MNLSSTSATGFVVANKIISGVFSTRGFLLADIGSPRFVLIASAVEINRRGHTKRVVMVDLIQFVILTKQACCVNGLKNCT